MSATSLRTAARVSEAFNKMGKPIADEAAVELGKVVNREVQAIIAERDKLEFNSRYGKVTQERVYIVVDIVGGSSIEQVFSERSLAESYVRTLETYSLFGDTRKRFKIVERVIRA